jgi:magnesium transporter
MAGGRLRQSAALLEHAFMIVNCIVYRDGKRLREADIDEIGDLLRQPDTFVWLGLHEPDAALLRRVQVQLGLHELAVEDAYRAHQRPKIEEYAGSLFVVLRTAWLQEEAIHVGETHLFVGKRFLVSVRHGPSSSYARVRETVEARPAQLAKGPVFALYALMDFVVDNYMPIVDHFKGSLDALEEDIFMERVDREAIGRLYQLRRNMSSLRAAAAPLREVCSQLMSVHGEFVPQDMTVWFRDVQDHLARVIAAIDNMLELVTAAMQVSLAFATIHQNDAVKRLAGWGAILAVPTVVFSMYGMNFSVMPELGWRFSYPLVLVGTGAACIVLYRKLKRGGWL